MKGLLTAIRLMFAGIEGLPSPQHQEALPQLKRTEVWLLQAAKLYLKPVVSKPRRAGDSPKMVAIDVTDHHGLILATFSGSPTQIQAYIQGILNVARHTLKQESDSEK